MTPNGPSMPGSVDAPGVAGSDADALTLSEFEACYREHYRMLCVVAAAQLGSRDGAEDAVQDAMRDAWRKRSHYTPGSDLRAWISSFVRNAARNQGRSSRRQRIRLRALSREPMAETETNPTAQAAPALTTDAPLDLRVQAALDGLSPTQRECFLLRVVRDHSYAHISEILGIPAATARTHTHRARLALAAALSEGDGSP